MLNEVSAIIGLHYLWVVRRVKPKEGEADDCFDETIQQGEAEKKREFNSEEIGAVLRAMGVEVAASAGR